MSFIRRTGGLGFNVVTALTQSRIADLTSGRIQPDSGRPFDLALRASARLAGVDVLRRAVFAEELALLDRYLADLAIVDPEVIERAMRERTIASITRRIRRYYMTLPPARLRQWLPLAGDLEATVRGGALLVGAHFGAGMLTPMALSQLQVPVMAIVRTPIGHFLVPKHVTIVDLRIESPRRAATDAWATLRRGGVVFIAVDGSSGTPGNDIEVNVLGRRHRMSRGFAELAVAASVAPTPVFSRADQSGHITTWAEPALTVAGNGHQARVASLAHAYARHLSTMFERYPGNVAPPAMRSHLNGPRADDQA